MKVILIIMAMSYSFTPMVVHTETIEFSSMQICIEAKTQIENLKDFKNKNPKTPNLVCVEY